MKNKQTIRDMYYFSTAGCKVYMKSDNKDFESTLSLACVDKDTRMCLFVSRFYYNLYQGRDLKIEVREAVIKEWHFPIRFSIFPNTADLLHCQM